MTDNKTENYLIAEMSQGVAGAMDAIIDILRKGERIDPDSGLGNVIPIIQMDAMDIKGTQIYILWNDQCKKDTRRLLMLLRAVELGFFKAERIKEIAGDQTSAKRLLEAELDALDDKVCAKLPAFQRKPARSAKDQAHKIIAALTKKEFDYITHLDRGAYRGFAALHDLCDANMLLETEDVDRANEIMDHFNRFFMAN